MIQSILRFSFSPASVIFVISLVIPERWFCHVYNCWPPGHCSQFLIIFGLGHFYAIYFNKTQHYKINALNMDYIFFVPVYCLELFRDATFCLWYLFYYYYCCCSLYIKLLRFLRLTTFKLQSTLKVQQKESKVHLKFVVYL